MYHLEEIVRINRSVKPQAETVRHCSFQPSRKGVVLHSANQRATVFLSGRQASAFRRKVSGVRAPFKRDAIIESYF